MSTEPQWMKILVVDDDEANLVVLRNILGRAGYSQVRTLQDPRQALERYRAFEPDLLLLDYHMPHLDGLEVLQRLRPHLPQYLPVLMLTADERPELRERALAEGVRDFLSKPVAQTEVLLRIRNLLEARSFHLQLRDRNVHLEALVRERTALLEQAQVETLTRLARVAEYRDDEAGRHVWRVARTAEAIAERLGCDAVWCALLLRAARLHDVGKITVPDGILLKPGPLTRQEFEVIKTHTEVGARLLSGGSSQLMRLAASVALNHHERWDGEGYPRGLAGEEIPLEGRIVALADAFDVLIHDRAHRKAVTAPEARAEIERQRGGQFDPRVVDAFAAAMDDAVLPVEVPE